MALWKAALRETWMSIFQSRLRTAAMASSGATTAVAMARLASRVGEAWRNSTVSADSTISKTNNPPSAMQGKLMYHLASSGTFWYRFSISRMLQTARPRRTAVPAESSETPAAPPGWSRTVTPITSRATKPIMAKAWLSWPRARTVRRYRCRMKMYQATERSSSSAPGRPVSGVSGQNATLAAHAAVTAEAPASSQPVLLRRARTRMSADKAA